MPSIKKPSRIAVLLVNLGTPDAPDRRSIRRYLKEFLSDPRVVEAPRLVWWCVLNFFILTFRPSKLVPEYRKIWREDGSPLRAITDQQVTKLQLALNKKLGANIVVVKPAMTYGSPSFTTAFAEMKSKGIEKILVLPLFPQYSATTTAASFDGVNRALQGIRDIPEMRFIKRYHNNPRYIEALAQSVKQHWDNRGRKAKLLFSFHGIPQDYVDKGDPYAEECMETTKLVAKRLGLDDDEFLLAYQSRVGKLQWLKPYTDETVTLLGKSKQVGLDVICPGFSADCLETLVEIDEENREYFELNGGKDFHYIPALNDHDLHVAVLKDIVLKNMESWLES